MNDLDECRCRADQIIRLSSPQGQACYPELLRRVHYRDPETGKEYVFLTNRLGQTRLPEPMDLWAMLWPQPPDNQKPVLFN